MLLAVATGGGVLALADNVEPQIGNEGVEPASKETVEAKEPVNPDTNDRLSPGGKKDGQDLTGSQASSTQLREGGLLGQGVGLRDCQVLSFQDSYPLYRSPDGKDRQYQELVCLSPACGWRDS